MENQPKREGFYAGILKILLLLETQLTVVVYHNVAIYNQKLQHQRVIKFECSLNEKAHYYPSTPTSFPPAAI